ncbi:MAG: glyoxalase, partial [Acidimicrobiia bacterium]
DPDASLALYRDTLSKYVEFAAPSTHVKLALYGRRALAKNAGVPPDATGSSRVVIGGDAGAFTDPDGFAWETLSA